MDVISSVLHTKKSTFYNYELVGFQTQTRLTCDECLEGLHPQITWNRQVVRSTPVTRPAIRTERVKEAIAPPLQTELTLGVSVGFAREDISGPTAALE